MFNTNVQKTIFCINFHILALQYDTYDELVLYISEIHVDML